MNSISELLQNILTAVYGRDVRQSIHDAITECYSDVSNAQTIAAQTISEVDDALSALQLTIQDIDDYKEQLEGSIEDVSPLVESLNSAIESANSAIETIQGEFETLKDSIEEATENAEDAADSVGEKIEALSELTTLVNESIEIVQGLVQQVQTAATTASELSASMTTLTNRADAAITNAENIAGEIEDIRDSVQEDLENLEGVLTSAEQRVSTAIGNFQTLQEASPDFDVEEMAGLVANAIAATEAANQAAEEASAVAEQASAIEQAVEDAIRIQGQIDTFINNFETITTNATNAAEAAEAAADAANEVATRSEAATEAALEAAEGVVSPTVEITTADGIRTIKITDKDHPEGQTYTVSENADAITSYEELEDKPSFDGIPLSGEMYLDDFAIPQVSHTDLGASSWNVASGSAVLKDGPLLQGPALYLVHANFSFASNSTGWRSGAILSAPDGSDGDDVITDAMTQVPAPSGAQSMFGVVAIIFVPAGSQKRIQYRIRHNAGTTLSCTVTARFTKITKAVFNNV